MAWRESEHYSATRFANRVPFVNRLASDKNVCDPATAAYFTGSAAMVAHGSRAGGG